VLWLSPIISATWEEEIGEMWFEGSSDNKKKSWSGPNLKKQKTSWAWWSVIPATWGGIG
jgi:hypothetical protein